MFFGSLTSVQQHLGGFLIICLACQYGCGVKMRKWNRASGRERTLSFSKSSSLSGESPNDDRGMFWRSRPRPLKPLYWTTSKSVELQEYGADNPLNPLQDGLWFLSNSDHWISHADAESRCWKRIFRSDENKMQTWIDRHWGCIIQYRTQVPGCRTVIIASFIYTYWDVLSPEKLIRFRREFCILAVALMISLKYSSKCPRGMAL